MKIKKTVSMGDSCWERKSYIIHTVCGEQFECHAAGSQGYNCNGVKYKSLKEIKEMVNFVGHPAALSVIPDLVPTEIIPDLVPTERLAEAKDNAEEDYLYTAISVLKYISILEEVVNGFDAKLYRQRGIQNTID